ncbi:MAG: hypothetical protein HY317_04885 [Acidobacteria bacterium]|nr:hypothetical protein [Acidobacteriota bacterium]
MGVELIVKPRRGLGSLDIYVNAERNVARFEGSGAQAIVCHGRSDSQGNLVVRVVPTQEGHGRPPLLAISVTQRGPPRVPWDRIVTYAALLGLASVLGSVAAGCAAGGVATLAAATGLLGAALLCGRLQAVLFLPWALAILCIGTAIAGVARVLGLPRPARAVICCLFVLRSAVALQPDFPAIDAAFHSENVQRFGAGELITSRAPSPRRGEAALAVPYPPAFYALMNVLVELGWPDTRTGVRLAMAVLEGATPVLLFVLMRRFGAGAETAGLAASVQAAMPESILVLAKGIAANITGQWTSLLVVLALGAAVRPLLLAGLMSLAFLSHLGSAGCLVSLLVVWSVRGALARTITPRRALAVLALAGLGLAIAWAVYYREVAGVASAAAGSLGSHLTSDAGDFFRARWVRAGKLMQDMLLKFGVLPVVFAGLWVTRMKRGPLEDLLASWMAAGAGIGVVALVTPIPLRFEYFLVPALAAAAAMGAERLSRRWRVALVAVPLAVQAVLAAVLLARRFYLISVIMESERWPFPVRL